MKGGTSRKMEIFYCIQTYSVSQGFFPTIRELYTKIDLKSTSSVHNYLVWLKEKGLIVSV